MTPVEQIGDFPTADEVIADLRAKLDALEAEHADRVWLTRDEAPDTSKWNHHWTCSRQVQPDGCQCGLTAFRALLDERIGDTKPTSIRAMIDGENPPLKKKGAS